MIVALERVLVIIDITLVNKAMPHQPRLLSREVRTSPGSGRSPASFRRVSPWVLRRTQNASDVAMHMCHCTPVRGAAEARVVHWLAEIEPEALRVSGERAAHQRPVRSHGSVSSTTQRAPTSAPSPLAS
jgi:hypothetical protein